MSRWWLRTILAHAARLPMHVIASRCEFLQKRCVRIPPPSPRLNSRPRTGRSPTLAFKPSAQPLHPARNKASAFAFSPPLLEFCFVQLCECTGRALFPNSLFLIPNPTCCAFLDFEILVAIPPRPFVLGETSSGSTLAALPVPACYDKYSGEGSRMYGMKSSSSGFG